MAEKFKADFAALGRLTERNLKLFFKDKMQVFFSLLAPLIVLFLYVAFLGDVQMDSLRSSIPEGLVDEKLLKGVINGWMLSGILAVTCITVAVSVSSVTVSDNEAGITADFDASPVSQSVIRFAYMAASYVCTLAITCLILAIGLIYLAIAGRYLSVGAVFAILGNLFLSALSATLFSTVAVSFFRSTSALGGFIGIVSAAIGFLMGAYIPLSVLGKGMEYVACFLPGTYSGGIFRDLFISGALEQMSATLPQTAINSIAQSYGVNVNFFGYEMPSWLSAVMLFASVIFFAILLIALSPLMVKIRRGAGKKSKKVKAPGEQ